MLELNQLPLINTSFSNGPGTMMFQHHNAYQSVAWSWHVMATRSIRFPWRIQGTPAKRWNPRIWKRWNPMICIWDPFGRPNKKKIIWNKTKNPQRHPSTSYSLCQSSYTSFLSRAGVRKVSKSCKFARQLPAKSKDHDPQQGPFSKSQNSQS